MPPKRKTFGQVLREKRLAKGFSLRKFAELIDVSPTYLSLVEQDKVERPPTVERLRRMAELLEEDVDDFIALAGRVSEDLPEIIRSERLMPDLLRGAKGLSKKQLEEVLEQIRRMKGKEGD